MTSQPTESDRPLPAVPGVRHEYVDAGGLRMHVAIAGADHDETVVLLHGWPEHWYCFRHLIPKLAGKYRVVVPDLRGFGWTDAPRAGYGKDQLGADVVHALDALGIDDFYLVGHDWGGFAGYHVALAQPQRVIALVAMNTGHLWLKPGTAGAPWRLAYQPLLATPVIGRRLFLKLMLAGLARNCEQRGAWDPQARASFLGQFDEPARARATVGLYRSFVTREAPAILRGRYRGRVLEMPVLAIHGRDDPVIDEGIFAGLDAAAPDLEIALVDGAGHFVAEEAPDTVLDVLLPFLTSNSRR